MFIVSLFSFTFLAGAQSLGKAFFGQGSGPVFMNNVECQGTEDSIFFCLSDAIGVHDCDHNNDAGVVCPGKVVSLVPYLFSMCDKEFHFMLCFSYPYMY